MRMGMMLGRKNPAKKSSQKSSHGSARAAMVANVDHEVLAMDHKTTFSSAAAAIGASLVIVMSTSALAACKTTLRGELVQAPGGGNKAYPREFLFFSLSETAQDSATSAEKRLKPFQSFIVPNTSTTLPIPFALDIDSPKDCPSELELSVGTDRTDQPDPTPRFRYNSDHVALTGGKTIHLDKFESIPVWGPRF